MAEKWTIRYWDNIANCIVWKERGYDSYEAAKQHAEENMKMSEPGYGYEIFKEK